MNHESTALAQAVQQQLGAGAQDYERTRIAKKKRSDTREFVAQLVQDGVDESDPFADMFSERVSVSVLITDVRLTEAQLKALVVRISEPPGSGVLVFKTFTGSPDVVAPKARD